MGEVHTIGVVDDDQEVRESTAAFFRAAGFAVHVFADAESLLASPFAGAMECLITDLHMPGMDGFGLRHAWVRLGNRAPVIMVTAFANAEIRNTAESQGIAAFFEKPVEPDLLLREVRALLAA